MFFECRHWCFRGRGIGVFACWRHCFLAGENLRAAQKNRKTLMRGRDGQAKGSCRRFHSRMRGCATDSSRPVRGGARAPPPAGASVRPGRAARPRHAGAERERVDRQRLTEPGVRQSSGALAAWYRWQHSSKDGAADSTTTTDYYAYRLALEQQQQQQARTRGGVAAILRELRRTCVSRKTRSARQRTGRWGQVS
eukprot:COSAG02_NODE_1100_length_14582_cov_130.690672_2_plen_195_part_00